MQHFDHIVIGVGSMGSSTCYHLASRGTTVLGIDQFTVPHDQGAHGGQSRIIRKAYFEHSDYIPLLQRAYDNWNAIEKKTETKIYYETGLLYAGPKEHLLLNNIKESARLYNIPLESISAKKFPQFNFPADFEILFEPQSGFLLPDVAIRTYVTEAKKAGAHIHENEKLISWKLISGKVQVKTDKNEYSCNKIVFTAGPWSAQLIPNSSEHLKITRQVLVWVRPNNINDFKLGTFPCWLAVGKPFYGFPFIPQHISPGPEGIKLAFHFPGTITDPDHVNRKISEEDTNHILDFLKECIPGAYGDIIDAKTCLYSNTPDDHFVIDNLPDMEQNVCMAWGFSGHGFKFVSAVGEVLADLAMYGKTSLPIEFLNASRF